MKKHYQIVDGNIVFKASDTDAALNDIRRTLESMYPRINVDGFGETPVDFDVEFSEYPLEECGEPYMCLSIVSEALGVAIDFTASKPTLINVDGEFGHWWDLENTYSSINEIYDEEDSSSKREKTLEDEIIDALSH